MIQNQLQNTYKGSFLKKKKLLIKTPYMCENAKYERTFEATSADFFKNYIACLLRLKECSQNF